MPDRSAPREPVTHRSSRRPVRDDDLDRCFLDFGLHRYDGLANRVALVRTASRTTETVGEPRNRPALVSNRSRSRGYDLDLGFVTDDFGLVEDRAWRLLSVRSQRRRHSGRIGAIPGPSIAPHQSLDVGLDRREAGGSLACQA
ncbi:MAG: hypothetical protein AB7U18_28125 [Dehalococcoidia bacterium]